MASVYTLLPKKFNSIADILFPDSLLRIMKKKKETCFSLNLIALPLKNHMFSL